MFEAIGSEIEKLQRTMNRLDEILDRKDQIELEQVSQDAETLASVIGYVHEIEVLALALYDELPVQVRLGVDSASKRVDVTIPEWRKTIDGIRKRFVDRKRSQR